MDGTATGWEKDGFGRCLAEEEEANVEEVGRIGESPVVGREEKEGPVWCEGRTVWTDEELDNVGRWSGWVCAKDVCVGDGDAAAD